MIDLSKVTSNVIEHIMQLNKTHHRKYDTNHPKENGQVEVTNRELENIHTKMKKLHKKYLENSLIEVVWEYNTT